MENELNYLDAIWSCKIEWESSYDDIKNTQFLGIDVDKLIYTTSK
jgi:hypothetical protein